MPSAEIISIGTELLLGEIVDINTQYLAQELKSIGIDVYRTTTIGDNIHRIQSAMIESSNRADIVITTGGLGPTENDLTRLAVAQAFGRELQFNPKLWVLIEERFKRINRIANENNRRQAFLPKGVKPIKNPVGTAPGFYLKQNNNLVICLPGVPVEMKRLFQHKVIPLLNHYYSLNQIIYCRVIHTIGIGESQIDSLISEFETLSNPTVGLSAHPGQVDIRLTAKAANLAQAEILLQPIINQIYKKLGEWIFGIDSTKLSDVVLDKIKKGHHKIIISATSNANLITKMLPEQLIADNTKALPHNRSFIENQIQSLQQDINTKLLQLELKREKGKSLLQIILITSLWKKQETYYFAGHPDLFSEWANNMILNFLRLNLD